MNLRCVFRPTDDDEYLDFLFGHGITGLEVLHQEPYLEFTEQTMFEQRVQSIVKKYDSTISVHAPHIDVNLGSLNRRMRTLSLDALLRAAQWARLLDADVLVIHPGLGVSGMTQGAWHHGVDSPRGWQHRQLGLVAEAIQHCARLFPDLTLAVENMIFPHEFFRTPLDLRLLLERIQTSNVGICLDVGHAHAAQQAWEWFFSQCGEAIVHIHLHDNHGNVDEHLPVGQGTINYSGFLSKIRQFGYRGAVTLEYRMEQNPLPLLQGKKHG